MNTLTEFKFIPQGVCSKEYTFLMDETIIKDVEIVKGCPGNLAGIRKLIIDREAQEVIELLKGIECGPRNTSCPDQISIALQQYLDTI